MRRSSTAIGAALVLALGISTAPAMAINEEMFLPAELQEIGITLSGQDCEAMAGSQVVADDDGEEVTAAIETASIVINEDNMEACSIEGSIEGRIGYTVQLPLTDWNGRYFQAGCGGFCGYTPIAACAPALNGGFAVGAEDTGHVDPRGGAEWALDNAQAEIDWGYLSPHLLAVVAKSLIEDAYGQPASTSYYQGCSTGGRQALSEAQRYPDDFDGIIAGAPALYQNYLATLSQGGYEMANRRADGTVILDAAAVTALSNAVQAACGDGNGVVVDPASCNFSPQEIQCEAGSETDCLTEEQVAAAEAIYAPPVSSDGTVLYPGGMPVGSESLWMGWAVGTDSSYSGGGGYAQNVLRYLAFLDDPGASYDLADFDPDDYRDLDAKAAVYNADDADLSAFADAGGKLIMYHGLADPLITPYGTIDYFESVVDVDGDAAVTDDYARMFLLPGVSHCTGGPGEDTVDWLSAIVAWVEEGSAPSSVTAERIVSGEVTSTRVIEPFVSGSADSRISNWFGRPVAASTDPEAPVDEPEPPVEEPEQPVEDTEPPVEEPEQPVEDTEPPVEEPEQPVEDTELPAAGPPAAPADPAVPTADDEEFADELAQTGVNGSGSAAIVATLLLVIGAAALAVNRRRRRV